MDRYGDVFALGVESMDTEHRRLAALFDAFVACMKEENPLERARAIVHEALAVANAHFEHEEAMMAETHYPGIEEEKLQHRMLRLKLTTLVGDALNTGVCDPVTLENLATMQQLLFEHISGPDRELANYLIARGHK
jgi:hemerythrin-like metal-binding protein